MKLAVGKGWAGLGARGGVSLALWLGGVPFGGALKALGAVNLLGSSEVRAKKPVNAAGNVLCVLISPERRHLLLAKSHSIAT